MSVICTAANHIISQMVITNNDAKITSNGAAPIPDHHHDIIWLPLWESNWVIWALKGQEIKYFSSHAWIFSHKKRCDVCGDMFWVLCVWTRIEVTNLNKKWQFSSPVISYDFVLMLLRCLVTALVEITKTGMAEDVHTFDLPCLHVYVLSDKKIK